MYNRLYSSIVASSVWSESLEVCKVWVTLLAMQDKEGYVFGSPSGLARIAALPVHVVQDCLDKFLGPDPGSGDLVRAPEREGRRIEVVDGGWRLLNTKHYNDLANMEDRRDQYRESKRRQREKAKASTPVHTSPPSEVSSNANAASTSTSPETTPRTTESRGGERGGGWVAVDEVHALDGVVDGGELDV